MDYYEKNKEYINDHTEWLDSLGAAAFVIDVNHRVLFWSRSCEILTGVSSADVINSNRHWMGFYEAERPCLADMVLDDDWENKTFLYDHIEKAPSTFRGLKANNWCETPAGKKFLIFEANALFDKDNNIIGVLETLSDVTTLKNLEEDLEVLSKAVENCSSSVIITDPKGIIEFVNPNFCKTTGYSIKEAVGSSINIIRVEDQSVQKEINASIVKSGEWKGEMLSKKKDGSHYWDRCALSIICGEDGNIKHFVGIQEDISKEYDLAKKLNYEASHDKLTDLKNRREFEYCAEQLLSNKNEMSKDHSMCFMDLDNFKIINDTCGHAAGDELLRQVSSLFKECVRKNDLLARLGGDEFGILMENCELQHSNRVAISLLKAIEDYQFNWEGRNFRIGISIGIVVFNNEIPDLIELLRRADSACYMAKDLGRNQICAYCPENSELAERHGEMQWVTRIQNALDEDRFFLEAQAIVPLDANKHDIHYELLVRMRDDDGNSIPPGAFLPSAERYSLIVKLDQWVVKNAFSLLASYPAFQKQIHFVSINLSGQSLANENLLEFIVSQLKEKGIDGKKICFEITETSAITHIVNAIKFIRGIKEYGCSFALDDFGSGHSSFAYLKNLPVDYLKIDGLFVKNIVEDSVDFALVKSINEVGKILNIKTIAEFVENDDIKSMLGDIGVDYGQGYGIGKPGSFEALLKEFSGGEYLDKAS